MSLNHKANSESEKLDISKSGKVIVFVTKVTTRSPVAVGDLEGLGVGAAVGASEGDGPVGLLLAGQVGACVRVSVGE